MAITGTHLVRTLRSTMQKARSLWPRTRDRMEVRRQALKLRWWGHRHGEDGLLDLTYESIKSMPSSGVYEARISDIIGGQRNIRIIFLDPPSSWVYRYPSDYPTLWLLEVCFKKRDNWTKNDIQRFEATRDLVEERFF